MGQGKEWRGAAMSGRYETLFANLKRRDELAFVPFTVLGDPTSEVSGKIIEAMISGGADALELGIPYSDPVADGPTIQGADIRGLAAGVNPSIALDIVAKIREKHPEIPIGLLVYANLLVAAGIETFYQNAKESGVDSVLVADLPTLEAKPFLDAARAAGIQPVLLAPPNVSEERLAIIAREGSGYTYVITRQGVTGADEEMHLSNGKLLFDLITLKAPPPLLGFGISKPEHVRNGRAAGAAGVISGSAVVSRIAENLKNEPAMLEAVRSFVREMKNATLPGEQS